MKEFELTTGLLDRERKLILAKDYIEYENKDLRNDLFTRLSKADIVDFKHGIERIIWYEFSVGYVYTITFLSKDNKDLRIIFRDYFGLKSNYRHTYSEIINTIWEYYFIDVVNLDLDTFFENKELDFKELKVKQSGIEFTDTSQIIDWDEVDFKQYSGYFAVFEKGNPKKHKRFSFNEWNSERLLSIIRTVKKGREN